MTTLGEIGPEIYIENINDLKPGKTYAVINVHTFPTHFQNINTITFNTMSKVSEFNILINDTSKYKFSVFINGWGGIYAFEKLPINIEFPVDLMIRPHEIYSNTGSNDGKKYRIFPISEVVERESSKTPLQVIIGEHDRTNLGFGIQKRKTKTTKRTKKNKSNKSNKKRKKSNKRKNKKPRF